MAAACSVDLPISPTETASMTESVSNSNNKSVSRSPSTSSLKEDRWPHLLVSKKPISVPKNRKTRFLPTDKLVIMIDQEMAGAQDTIYLCNFRVSVDGEWLCLKELNDVEFSVPESASQLSSPSPEEPLPLLARDPVVIERSNLVNISKLIVKELIETSLKFGRQLDSDHMPLQHFFIVLEHVLRHGLKPKKGLLGPKKELWDILQTVEKYTLEAQDITSSVRDLPTVSTHMGRARAWLRLALMQKKLADYLKILIDHKDDFLGDFFEPDALMMSDEAIVIMGLLVGLNVVDCNLCVKEEDLDFQQGVIDFSLYLRSSHHPPGEFAADDLDPDNMTTVLDQKNYIEELNRHLNATVQNLQGKVESVTTTNALMKEDLAIAKNHILSLYEENVQLKSELGLDVNSDRLDEGGGDQNRKTKSVATPEAEELRQQLENEKRLRQESDKELNLQISLKAEMEVAMKLLEKDIHEKQDTIISLRRQLDDIKMINLEMYRKLQECEEELIQKGETVSRLQVKTSQIGKILNNLEKYNHLLKDAKDGGQSPQNRNHTGGQMFSRGKPIEKDGQGVKRGNQQLVDKGGKGNQLAGKESHPPSKGNQLAGKESHPPSKEGSSSNKESGVDQSVNKDKQLAEEGPGDPDQQSKTGKPGEEKEGSKVESVGGKDGLVDEETQPQDLSQPDECESSLKHKTELISKLEVKTIAMTDTIQKMEENYKKCDSERNSLEETARKLGQQIAEKEIKTSSVEGDMKIEREWRTSLQDTMVKDREKISQLHQEMAQLKPTAAKYVALQEEYYALKEKCTEHEQTLEELGNQLRIATLQVADLREEAIARVKGDGQWASDKEVTNCKACTKEFNITRRRHHCRNCGEIFCNACSDNTMSLPSSAKPVRVCDECQVFLVARNSVL